VVEHDGEGRKSSQCIDDAESFHDTGFFRLLVFIQFLSQSKEAPIGTINPMAKEQAEATDQGIFNEIIFPKLFCCKEKCSTRMNKLRCPMNDKVLVGHRMGSFSRASESNKTPPIPQMATQVEPAQ